MFNKNYFGNAFIYSTIEAVWRKGIIVPGYDSNVFRKDQCGAWMKKSEYGNTSSNYGWEIDHIRPKSKGGGWLFRSDHASLFGQMVPL